MKKLLLPLCLLATLAVSCQKQNSTSEISKNSKIPPTVKGDFYVPLTDSQIDSIGIEHNLFMSEAIQNFVFNTGNDSTEMRNDFMEIQNFDIPSDALSNFLDSTDNPTRNRERFEQSISNPYALTIVDSCETILNDSTNLTYDEINSFLNQMKDLAVSRLSGKDYEMTRTFISTFQKSCYFWMPAADGGSGIGEDFINNLSNQHTSGFQMQPAVAETRINWKEVAWVDGACAVAAFNEVKYLLEVPYGEAAVIAYCGWAAADGSALEVAHQRATGGF